MRFELQEVLRIVLDCAVQRIAANFLGVRVGIVTVRKEHDFDRHALRQQHVNAPKRGPDPCGVAVKNDRDMLGVAANQVDLARGQCRPTGRHHVGHPSLAHRHHIRVAFHQEAAFFLDNFWLRQVHPVEHLGLVVQGAFRRVEVFGNLLVRRQGAAAKSDDAARDIPDGEHDAAFEEVPNRPIVSLLAQSGLHQLLGGITRFLRRRRQGVPTVRAVPNEERVEDVVTESPFHEVAAPNRLAGIGVAHLVHEPFGRPSHQIAEALLGRCGRDLLRRALFFLNLDVVPARQHLERLRIAGLFQLHQKGHHAAALAAREAFENALGWEHVKRRCLFVGEGTQSAKRAARFLQLHVVAHHLFDDGGIHDLIDGFLRNHGVKMGRERLTKIPKIANRKPPPPCQ